MYMKKFLLFTLLFYLSFFLKSTKGQNDNNHLKINSENYFLNAQKKFNLHPNDTLLIVYIATQKMQMVSAKKVLATYMISTSKYGIGNQQGSNKTPLGFHQIKKKIGAKYPLGTIFSARQAIGQIAKIYTDSIDTPDDYVTSRILWLEGLEPGMNKGKNIDSYARYIYIHGTHEEGLLGIPASSGCIRMRNNEVIKLFDVVKEGTIVLITEK